MKAFHNITENKIEAIKKLRVFTTETFGVSADLKACKDFIALLQPYQQGRFTRLAHIKDLVSRLASYSQDDVTDALKAVGLIYDISR